MTPEQIKAIRDVQEATRILNAALERASAARVRCYLHDASAGYDPIAVRVSCAPEAPKGLFQDPA